MSEYDDGFDAGILHQSLAERHEERVRAFGAIRRAAEVARYCDAAEANWERDGFPTAAEQRRREARLVRDAIRAAIGSDKA